MPAFSRLLVANRGEIACRVLRTARAMGFESVAVFSAADRDAPHVRLADQAVYLGPAPAADSYLSSERVLEAARQSGADAVHPGYGFLSENAEFAAACAAAGLVFVGPPVQAMHLMADKARAKARMQEAGVSILPGFWEPADDRRLIEEAPRIGFPLLVKATAGGGGRGIRLVTDAPSLPEALASARAEAASAFGDGALMLERYLERARHVEVQIFADAHGNTVHLGERDCSAQRRRQKIIEEAPCPALSAGLRAALGAAAVSAARAVDYRGAGTVEFIVDPAGHAYFLEMNTRLQVEHPVTELVSGLDLVRLQLCVAAGEPLPLSQAQLTLSGHAIEARLYAEDPARGFAPQTGQVLRFDAARACAEPGVRIDSGVEEGSAITPFYDGLLAKIVAHGATREEARRRLLRALSAATLFGLPTNASFLCKILQSDVFAQGALHSALIDGWLRDAPSMLERPAPSDELWALAACVLAEGLSQNCLRPRAIAGVELTLSCDGSTRRARFERDAGATRVRFAEGTALELRLLARDAHDLRYEIGTLLRRVSCLRTRDAVHLGQDGDVFVFREPSSLAGTAEAADPRRVLAPLAGVLGRLAIAAGDEVRKGDVLLVIEAMKMETRVVAGVAARVVKVHRGPGDQVAADELLVELEPLPEES
jgi:geranyl-CoA carboxylase alpha subunit